MEYFLHRLQNNLQQVLKSLDFSEGLQATKRRFLHLLSRISSIGYTISLDDFEKRKLGIFNQLNFFQLITGIVVPIVAFLTSKKFPTEGGYIAILPAFISLFVLILNFFHKYQAALLCYFILYPVFTCFIFINGFNLGIELSFVLYGILSVFFLQDIGYMLFAVSLSMVSYFVLSITWKDYRYQLEIYNYKGYLINHAISILYIFYGLYLIKRENSEYQFGINTKNDELYKKNLEIEEQRKEISNKARLLTNQTIELDELNQVKDKLFSIISHDLKSPMYALQNLFINARKIDLPAEELKEMIPAVVDDLNYTTSLLENLLEWAKSQMRSAVIIPQAIDVSKLANETARLLHLQAKEKNITVETKTDLSVYAWADRNMISLVIRNLLSNAIKFTPENGLIVVGTSETSSYVEVFVKDTGAGISDETIKKIYSNEFFTTNGTHNERGTGLGITLCKEFLDKNDGHLMIETKPGSGSTFSFTLPLAK
ncbi:MAG TPA: HAMP domain-containing sensor histidine kinase [Chitinophagaceae bacterium]|nr:HAMP domain-containing sensor histidine kinase [Chitinophagaceae bacterium]